MKLLINTLPLTCINRALSFALKVRSHLIKYCTDTYPDYDLKIHKADKEYMNESVRKLFYQCLPTKVAIFESGNTYRTRRPVSKTEEECLQVNIHPTSVLLNKKARAVHFTEVNQLSAGKNYINHLSLIDSAWFSLSRL
jgi:hypothetical protein